MVKTLNELSACCPIIVDSIILDGVDLTTTLNTKLTADGIGKITESITEPVAPAVGDVWIDIS